MKPPIGIMQGRLSPPVGNAIQAFPRDTWQSEFASARKAGLDYIEWIFDREDLANPLMNDVGTAQMRALIKETGVQVPSVCADYFMSHPLLRGSPEERRTRTAKLELLIERCKQLEVHRVILPFVDQSNIEDAPQIEDLILLLQSLATRGIEIHLETSLAPAAFASLMERIGSPWIKVNYDTGNSASAGYDPVEEFTKYGHWIGSVHIKDRVKGGSTVPLGQGDANLGRVARLLKNAAYSGSYTLQVARGETNDEVATAIGHMAYWRAHLEAAEDGSAT